MRRLGARGSRAGALDVLQRIATWHVDQAQAQVIQASRLLEASQATVNDLGHRQNALAIWANQMDAGGSWPVLRQHALAGLASLRSGHASATAACAARVDDVSTSRMALQVVRARQRALERLAQRLVERETAHESESLARERDDDWLRASTRRAAE